MKRMVIFLLILGLASIVYAKDFEACFALKNGGDITSVYKGELSTEQLMSVYGVDNIEPFPKWTEWGGTVSIWEPKGSQVVGPSGASWQYVKDKLDAEFYLIKTEHLVKEYMEQESGGLSTTITLGSYTSLVNARTANRAVLANYSAYD